MKTSLLITSLVLAMWVPAIANDGISASPKLRQMLDSQKTVAATDYAIVTKDDGIIASPKLREVLNQQKNVAASDVAASKPATHCSRMQVTTIASPKAQESLKYANAESCCATKACVVACAN
ncbi:MAG: hypothetical protein QOD03_796 [Verrucomicrobiota bacterium]|jgi:hypothetical protein